MEIFFGWLVNTSLKGSILIGCILLMKGIFKNKLGARGHYYIWFLLLIRLFMPFAPESTMSIFNLFYNEHTNMMTKNIMKYDPEQIIEWFRQGENLLKTEGVTDGYRVFYEYISILFNSSIYFKLMLIWFVGVVFLTLYTIKMNMKMYLDIKKESVYAEEQTLQILENCKEKMQIQKSLPLMQTKAVETPSLFGLFKPCLLLPIDMEKKLSTKELHYVMLHELAHLKRKDITVYLMMGFLQILHWFNPIIWYGFYKMKQDCEVACDAMVLSCIGDEECKNYGHTIIHLLENEKKYPQPIGMAGFLGYKSEIKRRIKMITLFKKNTYKLSSISIVLLLIVSCTFLTNANTTNVKEVAVDINELSSQKEDVLIEEENEEVVEKKAMLWPVPERTKISSPYGERMHPKLKEIRVHTGIDIPGPEGTSIIAAAEGVVIHAEDLGGYGNVVIIDHGDGIATLYGQCSEILVKKDRAVKAGDEIAKVGSTGAATGAHLHFEVRKDGEHVDPIEYVMQ
ncbi:M56 family metallopeptidase [Clostridiaceae bacterium 35-E11]